MEKHNSTNSNEFFSHIILSSKLSDIILRWFYIEDHLQFLCVNISWHIMKEAMINPLHNSMILGQHEGHGKEDEDK